MNEAALDLVQIFIGLAGGLAVGSGAVAFLVVLDIIPRLVQVTKTTAYLRRYEEAVISGSLYWTLADFFNWQFKFSPLSTALIGLFAGCFIGLLAAALTEVINVLPILAKRLGLGKYLLWLLAGMILGKVTGSLLAWLFF